MSTLYYRPNCCEDCTEALEKASRLSIEIVPVLEVFPCRGINRYPKLVVGETDYFKEECINMLDRMEVRI